MQQDVSQLNSHPELPSFAFLRDGGGLEDFEIASAMVAPWELLLDIGHNASYMYDFLIKVLGEHKNITEK